MTDGNWQTLSFGELVKNLSKERVPLKMSDRAKQQGSIPYYGASGVIDHIDKYIFDGEYLLISEDGANLLARSSPIAFKASGRFWVNNHAHVVEYNGKAHLDYLSYYLNSIDISPYVSGSAQPKLNRRNLERIPIPLPSLEEQRHIANILDKADELRRKRQDSLALMDEFLRSVFLDMFGDPVVNPKGWPVDTLGDLASDVRYGTSKKSVSVCVNEDDVPILRIPNVMGAVTSFDDLKFTVLNEKELAKLRLEKGDLLFVRSNGNPDYIGRCSVFTGDNETAFASYLIRIRLECDELQFSHFVRDVVSSRSYRLFLASMGTTTAGNYNINSTQLKLLKIIRPPKDLWMQYVELRDAIIKQIVEMRMSKENFDLLFATLTQRAFRGELTEGT